MRELNLQGRKCVLHIGVEKTGSTSIRMALAECRHGMREQGILFPHFAGPRNHLRLVVAAMDFGVVDNIKQSLLVQNGMSEERFRAEFLADFHSELLHGISMDAHQTLSVPKWHTLVFSSELISSRLHTNNEIDRLIRWLKPHVDLIEVVVFLRRQDLLAESRFSSRLRQGETNLKSVFQDASRRSFLQSPETRIINEHHNWFNYKNLIGRFESAGQREHAAIKISPVIYDTPDGTPDVLDVFSEIIEFDIRPKGPGRTVNLNKAMNARAQQVVANFNKYIPHAVSHGGSNQIRDKTIKKIERVVPGKKREIISDEAKSFYEKFQTSNNIIRKNYFPESKEIFSSHFANRHNNSTIRIIDKMIVHAYIFYFIIYYYKEKITNNYSRLFSKKIIRRSRRFISQTLNRRGREFQLFFNNTLLKIQNKSKVHFQAKAPQVLGIENNAQSTFTIARIVGNDLPPRQAQGQSINNVDFILETEGDILAEKKVFILNRIEDSDYSGEIRERLASRGHIVIERKFVPSEYPEFCKSLPNGVLQRANDAIVRYRKALENEDPHWRRLQKEAILANAPKIRFFIDINGARNDALMYGKKRSNWTLVLDGACYIPPATAKQYLEDFTQKSSFVPYLILPMKRIPDIKLVDQISVEATWREEPQIAFHKTARLSFDERFFYGVRDKTSMLTSLGVPGPWQGYSDNDLIPRAINADSERGLFKRASCCVFRLPSDAKSGTLELQSAVSERHASRNHSILEAVYQWHQKYGG